MAPHNGVYNGLVRHPARPARPARPSHAGQDDALGAAITVALFVPPILIGVGASLIARLLFNTPVSTALWIGGITIPIAFLWMWRSEQ